MTAKKLEYSEVIQILDAEITWCNNNSDASSQSEYQRGFIKGLIQARNLITSLEQFNKDAVKEQVYVKRD